MKVSCLTRNSFDVAGRPLHPVVKDPPESSKENWSQRSDVVLNFRTPAIVFCCVSHRQTREAFHLRATLTRWHRPTLADKSTPMTFFSDTPASFRKCTRAPVPHPTSTTRLLPPLSSPSFKRHASAIRLRDGITCSWLRHRVCVLVGSYAGKNMSHGKHKYQYAGGVASS